MPGIWNKFSGCLQCALLIFYISLVFNSAVVFSISSPWYITRDVTTGDPSSTNWFPNDTTIVDTVVAPNGSIYVLDSNQTLYKFDDYTSPIQKVALRPPGPPGPPPPSWYNSTFDQLFRLWIHPQSYDPYIFRLRWSNMNASDFVMCEILWYNGVNYGNPSSPPPKSVLFSTRTIVKYIPDNKRYLHLGRDPGSAASLQLTYYHDNMYYLALLDMKSGISAPVVLKDYNDYILVAGVGLIGIVLECGAQPDLACLVSDSMAESKIFWMKSTGIQLNFTGLNWGSIPSSYMKFQQYQNFAPNITALFFPNIAALGRRVVLYQVNPTLVSRQYPEFTLPSTGNYQDRYDNFQFTKNGDAVLFAETENINAFSGYESKINIYAYYTSKNTASGGSYSASTVLQTSQNDTASLLVPHADGSFTVVGTTMGNFSNVDSPTGLLDANGYTYQALFFFRFQGIRIRTQALEFIDVVNNKFQVTVVLDGVTEADSPTVLPSINAQTGFNPIWMNGTVSVNFTGIFYGRQTMTLSFPNIPSNPSIETAVDVPPFISLVSPLNGTVGAPLVINVTNSNDVDWPEIRIGNFYCANTQPPYNRSFQCNIPEGGGANLPINLTVKGVSALYSSNFSYNPPTIDSISPMTNPTIGPITFTITGTNFGFCGQSASSQCGSPNNYPNLTITVGDRMCQDIRHLNTSLSCTVPQGVAGLEVDVIVNYFGQNSSTSNVTKFSSNPPQISSLSSNRIVYSSNNPNVYSFSVNGQNFGPENTTASLIFTNSNGTNFTACSSVLKLNQNMANCELLQNLPSPQVYNVSIFVAGQYSNADMQIRYGNFPPVANPTNATLSEDTMFQLALFGSDPDGDRIEAILTALPKNGTLYQYDPSKPNALGFEADLGGIVQGKVIDSIGRMVYVPNANFYGVDSLSFKVTDSRDNVITSSAEVIVPITINPVPDPPVVSNVPKTGQEDTVFNFDIPISDVDTPLSDVSIVIDTVPSNGNIEYMLNSTASIYILTAPFTIPPGNHSLKYTPNPNFSGQDQFTFHANDGLNNSAVATASIFVNAVNDKPVAQSDAVTTVEDQGCIIRFAVEDVDQPASIRQRVKIQSWDDTLGNLYQVNLDGVKYGSPVGSNTEITDDNNRLWFEPKPDGSGYARVNFTATDNSNDISNLASIGITVTPVNDAPQIVKCAEEILLTSPIRNGFSVIPVTLRVKDADSNENLSFQLVEAPQKGKLLLDGKDVGVGVRYFVGSSVQPNSEVIIILNYQLLFQGGGNPFTNFSYRIFDRMESSSATCTVKFTIKCPPPLYNNNFKERDGDICEPCPTGAVCSEDARYPPFAAPGYWKNAESGNGAEAMQASFLPCSPPSACVSDQLSDGCAVGYTGVRCGTCSRNYYRLGSNCEKCPDNTWKNVLIFMACIVVGCIVLFALFNFVTRGPSLGFVSIVVGFLQTILILNDLKLKWSPSFQAAINNLSVFTLNIELTSPECMATEYEFDFAMKNRIALMVPLLFLLLLAFVPLFAWWRVRALGQFLNALIFGGSKVSIGELKQNQRRIWLLCLKVFNMFLNIIFVPAASQALELFDCSIESDGFYYLDAEPSSRCYTPKWAESLPISGMALIFYVVGIPTYFSFLYYSLYQTTRTSSFWMKRKQNAEAIVDKGSNHLKPESQHFVVVQIIQKLCFITVKLFFTKYIPLQAILINLILIGYLMFVVRHFPYRYTTLNNLELICTGASIFILNIGLLFYTQNFTTQGQIDALTGVALGSVFGSLILVGIAAIYEFKRSVQEWDLSRKNSVVQGSKRTSMLVA